MDGCAIAHKGLGVTELMTQLCYLESNHDLEIRVSKGLVLHLVFRSYVQQVFMGWRFCEFGVNVHNTYQGGGQQGTREEKGENDNY